MDVVGATQVSSMIFWFCWLWLGIFAAFEGELQFQKTELKEIKDEYLRLCNCVLCWK